MNVFISDVKTSLFLIIYYYFYCLSACFVQASSQLSDASTSGHVASCGLYLSFDSSDCCPLLSDQDPMLFFLGSVDRASDVLIQGNRKPSRQCISPSSGFDSSGGSCQSPPKWVKLFQYLVVHCVYIWIWQQLLTSHQIMTNNISKVTLAAGLLGITMLAANPAMANTACGNHNNPAACRARRDANQMRQENRTLRHDIRAQNRYIRSNTYAPYYSSTPVYNPYSVGPNPGITVRF